MMTTMTRDFGLWLSLFAAILSCAFLLLPSGVECNDALVVEHPTCTLKLGGNNYDLRSLDKDWEVVGGDNVILFNPCGSLKGHDSRKCPRQSTGMCLVDKDNKKNGLESFGLPVRATASNITNDKDFFFTYLGEGTSTVRFPFTCIVRFICSQNDNPPGTLAVKDSFYTITWETKAACRLDTPPPAPGNGGDKASTRSWFATFFYLTVAGALLYFVGGSIYRAVVLNARGWDILPHSDFWFDVLDTSRELARNISYRLWGGSGGYQQI